MDDLVIGIDLGTTNSCACIFRDNQLKILENKEGGRITPSYVFFTEKNGVIVGQYAKRMADAKPEYGVYEIKRLVGRKYDDPYVKKNLNYLPFQVKNIGNEPAVVIQNKSQIIKKSPQDLCTFILTKIKEDVQAKVGHPINKAVITVPAYFNIAQREVTLAAATNAGFTVLKLLNEPTAAALSYYYENKQHDQDNSHSLVYDLGGGTFDVAILSKNDAQIEIIAVDGDTHLGGHDFDNLLVEHICQILINKYNFNPKNDRRSIRRLNNECEEAKKILSVSEETTIILTAFIASPATIEIPISRSSFEELIEPLLKKTIAIIDRCLVKSTLNKDDIREVIMCGGSTRIPRVQELVSAYFGGKALNKFVNPDECVAEGAALQGAMFSGNSSQTITQIKIIDVTALSLGISNFVDMMTFLIKRNTPIPTSNSTKRITVYNNQTNMTFDIFEGERLDARKNHFLGVLEICDLTPAPPGQCSVEVTMRIDQNGILTVSARETVSNRTKDVKIVYARGKRSDSEVKNAVVDASENKEEDQRFSRFAEVKGYLIKYCVRAVYNMEEKNLIEIYKEVYERCGEAVKVLKFKGLEDECEVVSMRDQIVALVAPIQKKHKFVHMP